jgi:hypothetical protein
MRLLRRWRKLCCTSNCPAPTSSDTLPPAEEEEPFIEAAPPAPSPVNASAVASDVALQIDVDDIVRACFELFETDGAGMDACEVRPALRHMGLSLSIAPAPALLAAFDSDDNRVVSLAEFADLVRSLRGPPPAAGPSSTADLAAAADGGSATTASAPGVGMAARSDAWPRGLYGPPPSDATALDPHGPWGMAARGVEVRACDGQPTKGHGVFAVRPMPSGSLVGIYYGEALSEREYLVRHASTTAELARLRSLSRGPYDAVIDRATRAERRARLEALTAGEAPCGGPDNQGA